MPARIDPHILYEASVQGTETDIAFIERVWRRHHPGKAVPLRLREDFCGTALLACEWVRAHSQHEAPREALGVDLHAPTLDWCRRHRRATLPYPDRLTLHCADVLTVNTPPADVVAALNFSYLIFRERHQLRRYFQAVFKALVPGGLFLLDLFGGPNAQKTMTEEKQVPAGKDINGRPYPAFTYQWDQARFNAVDSHIRCHIHFSGKNIHPRKKAFTYAWRLWGLSEIRDLLHEVGFTTVDTYFEGWSDEHHATDGVFRRRTQYEDMDAWVAYLTAFRP